MLSKNSTMKIDMKFRQMTDDEIIQLKREMLASTLVDISEENNCFKNGEVYLLTFDEALKIVKSLGIEKLFYINDRRFALIRLDITGNKIEFGLNKMYNFKEYKEEF